MSEALIEAVAVAILDARYQRDNSRLNLNMTWDKIDANAHDVYRSQARAALAAIDASGTHVVVPAEATDEMIAAAKANNYEWPACCYGTDDDVTQRLAMTTCLTGLRYIEQHGLTERKPEPDRPATVSDDMVRAGVTAHLEWDESDEPSLKTLVVLIYQSMRALELHMSEAGSAARPKVVTP